MVEVVRMWTGLLNEIRSSFNYEKRDTPIAPSAVIEADVDELQSQLEDTHHDFHVEQILSAKPSFSTTTEDSYKRARSISPLAIPHSITPTEVSSPTKNAVNTKLSIETTERLKRTTPVVEFIEYNRNRIKARKRKARLQKRRNSEPMHNSFKDKMSRAYRASAENPTNTTLSPSTSRNLGVMGKSTSLRDIFTLKKSISTGGNLSKPSQFLAHLRTQPPGIQEIQRLQHILESQQWAFIQKFVEKGGAMVLFTVMSSCSHKRMTTPEDINLCNACCACIFALLCASDGNAELCEKMELAVDSLLAKEMPRTDYLLTCANQISNILTICGNPAGHKFVLQAMEERGDFPLVIELLKTDLSIDGSTQNEENTRIKVVVMSLVNTLIKQVDDTEKKFKLINKFLQLRIFPVLMDLRRIHSDELLDELTEFNELLEKEYFFLLTRSNAFVEEEHRHTIIVNIPILHMTTATMRVPFIPHRSTVGTIISYIYNQTSYLLQFDEKFYGIFVVDNSDAPKKTLQIYGQRNPEVFESFTSISSVSIGESRDDFSSLNESDTSCNLSVSEEFDILDPEDDIDSKTKSPREKSFRRSSHKYVEEKVVINPLFGKVNPILSPVRAKRRLSIYTKRVLTFSQNEDDDEEEQLELDRPKKGEWLPSTHTVFLDIEGWELKLKPWDLVITWKGKAIPIRVEPETTTFSDVIEDTLISLKKQDEDRIFEYSLVIIITKAHDDMPETVIWLEPMKYVSSLPPNLRDLELRTRSVPLNIRSKDSTTHAVLVNDSTTLKQVISEFGNKLGLQGRHLQDYGLLDKITGEWLESGHVLSLLEREKYDLHFLLRPRPICVVYQVEDCDLPNLENRKVRNTTAYSMIPLYESPSNSHFGLPLSQQTATSTYDQGLSDEAHSFKTEDMLVHFTLCVSQVQQAVCKELGLDPEEYAMYKESVDDKIVELTQWKSLRNQGVTPNSKILLFRVQEREEAGNDVDIWEEPTSKDTLRFEEGSNEKSVAAGTLNQLVRILTSENDHDVFYERTFMLTYRSFTDSKTLMRKLGERYTTPPNIDEKLKKIIKARVGIVLKHWITHEDPAEKDVILDEIAKFVDSIEEDFSDLANMLEKSIQNERERLNSPRSDIVAPPPDESVRLSPSLFNLNLLDLDEYTVACQLALQDSERYSKLKAIEFFNQAWLRNKAPNLLAMVAHFNSISSAVATSIVTERLIKKRVKIVEKHIVIAEWLRKLNDFFSLQAFICGINSSAVNRLKFTMERISSQSAQTLAQLEELMSMENSYKNYRQALHAAKPPRIPHIGVYMTDLTFIDEGNSDNYGNLINFSKRALVGKILIEIESHRKDKYQLTPAKKIEQFINHLPRYPENELYLASLECEPRGAAKSSIK